MLFIAYLFYNKIYKININPHQVYEIIIKKSYPYEEITLTTQEEINEYLKNVNNLKYTHPHINTGKGWNEDVTIKSINKDGIYSEYRYFILGDYISIGFFRYQLID